MPRAGAGLCCRRLKQDPVEPRKHPVGGKCRADGGFRKRAGLGMGQPQDFDQHLGIQPRDLDVLVAEHPIGVAKPADAVSDHENSPVALMQRSAMR